MNEKAGTGGAHIGSVRVGISYDYCKENIKVIVELCSPTLLYFCSVDRLQITSVMIIILQ